MSTKDSVKPTAKQNSNYLIGKRTTNRILLDFGEINQFSKKPCIVD